MKRAIVISVLAAAGCAAQAPRPLLPPPAALALAPAAPVLAAPAADPSLAPAAALPWVEPDYRLLDTSYRGCCSVPTAPTVVELWLEGDGVRSRVALIHREPAVRLVWPELRYSEPRYVTLDATLDADALRVAAPQANWLLRVEGDGEVVAEPADAPVREARVVDGALVLAGVRYELDAEGRVDPPLYRGATLRFTKSGDLSAERRWLLVLAEIAALEQP